MTRRCSHCCNNGHNSRTCPNRGVKLFGVRLTDGSIRKSASMGNLSHYSGSGLSSAVPTNPGSPGDTPENGVGADGYASEDFVPGSASSSCRERKKGVPWTEEEHRMFLLGLKKLGKGDWRGIARNFVVSRTPTQVASHAQKYFIRQTNISRRKRRSSLFDIISDQPADVEMIPNGFPSTDDLKADIVSNLLPVPTLNEKCESMDSTNSNEGEMAASTNQETYLPSFPVEYPGFMPHYFPVSLPIWSELSSKAIKEETGGVYKPKAIYTKSPLNVDELVGLSKLSLGDSLAHREPSILSINLSQGSGRQSAFHANPLPENGKMNSSGSPIHAV